MNRLALALAFGSLLVLALLIGAALADAVPSVGATTLIPAVDPSPEIIVVTATPYRCSNGDVLGSSTACPMAVLNVGTTPTPTPDRYHVEALEAGGRVYQVYRGWSYSDVVIISLLAIGVGILGFRTLRGEVRG